MRKKRESKEGVFPLISYNTEMAVIYVIIGIKKSFKLPISECSFEPDCICKYCYI